MHLTTDQKVGGSNPSERAVQRPYLLSKVTTGSRKYIINLVTGHKKEIRPGVWKLRVPAGKNPLTGKYEYLSKTVECGPRKADVELAKLVEEVSNRKEPARVTILLGMDAPSTSVTNRYRP